ncbi:MAG: hypothetical protein WA133_03855 [Syntrophales bacterium]
MRKYLKLFNSLAASALLVILTSQGAAAFEIGARGYLWFPTLKSNVRDSGNVLAGDFNLKDDLSLGSQSYPSIEVYGGLGKSHFSLMYTQADYSGSTNLASQIIFNGATFNVGTGVDSSFEIKMLDLAYKYDVIDLENILAGFSLSAIGKLKYIEGDTRIAGGGNDTSKTFKIAAPMVGAAAHIGILANILEARLELTGVSYKDDYLYEVLADLSLTPFPLIDVHAGYKVIGVHVDYDDVYFASDFTGPYLALTVGF